MDLSTYIPAGTNPDEWREELSMAAIDPKFRARFRDDTGITLSRPSMVLDAIAGREGYDAAIVHAVLSYFNGTREPTAVATIRRDKRLCFNSTLRSSGKPMKRSKLRQVSDKKRRRDVTWHAITEAKKAEGVTCEVAGPQCWRDADLAGHHKLARSQGGKNTRENHLLCCPMCHREIHIEPAWAVSMGFIITRASLSASGVSESQDEAREVSQNIVTGATPQRRTGTPSSDLKRTGDDSRRSA